MPVYKDRDVKSKILSLGFQISNDSRNKHIYYCLYKDGIYTGINTHFSKNGQDIDDHLISQIAKQMGITRQEFIKIMKGEINKEEYLSILQINGKL